MKKEVLVFLSVITLMFTGCGKDTEPSQLTDTGSMQSATEALAQTQPAAAEVTIGAVLPIQPQTTEGSSPAQPGEVLDLTALSSTMVYSEVFNMLMDPDRYVGKVVKMNGISACFTNPQTSKLYYACIVADATGCCAQGLEYVLPEGEAYPDLDTTITVTGTFALYTENGYKCFHLVDAQLV